MHAAKPHGTPRFAAIPLLGIFEAGTAAAWSVGVTGLGASSGGASPRFAAIPLLGIFEAGTAAARRTGVTEWCLSSGGASPRFAAAPLKPFLAEDGVLTQCHSGRAPLTLWRGLETPAASSSVGCTVAPWRRVHLPSATANLGQALPPIAIWCIRAWYIGRQSDACGRAAWDSPLCFRAGW